MIKFNFDLISDLHVEMWDTNEIVPTALNCVVAGNIAQHRKNLVHALSQLSNIYNNVFYIDGTLEHLQYLNNLDSSYEDLTESLRDLDNVHFLHNNLIIADNYAIIATNGWWDYGFEQTIGIGPSLQFTQELMKCGADVPIEFANMADTDTSYLTNSIARLQKYNDVKKIIIITHTVPHSSLINHDVQLAGQPDLNLMGNSKIVDALDADINNKVAAWCFGHYSGDVDTVINGIRFVNNARGMPGATHASHVYYPKSIII